MDTVKHTIAFEPEVFNSTEVEIMELQFPMLYRVVATAVHGVILLGGICGNILLTATILRTRCLQTPTYRFLVSLAVADLLVLISAVPEAMISHHIGKRWIAGQVACSMFVFSNFLGINAGSMSILAFTVEIYIAICRPLISQRYFTASRTNLWILVIWLSTFLYCAPWLYLTDVRPDPEHPTIQQCDFRPSTHHFTRYYFLSDLVLFYLVPLIVAVGVHTKIGSVLQRADQRTVRRPAGVDEERAEKINDDKETSSPLNRRFPQEQLHPGAMECAEHPLTPTRHQASIADIDAQQQQEKKHSRDRAKSRAHVLRMLIVIVTLFIITWLPYRGLLVYNTFAAESWLDLWFLFFAKTLIYFNSAMNPLLYSAMNLRFRKSLYRTITCQPPFDDQADIIVGVFRSSLISREGDKTVAAMGTGNGNLPDALLVPEGTDNQPDTDL